MVKGINTSTIDYVYSASGAKLRVIHRPNVLSPLSTTTDYVNGYIFTNNSLSMALTDNGYYTFSNTGDSPYHFYLKDHQGNNRVVVSQSGSVEQINHYYPYGALFAESTNDDVQRFKYNGKELDRKFGLDWYDHGARHNDAAIGRWHSMDKNAEKYYGISPYAYCVGTPISGIDMDGKKVIWINGWTAKKNIGNNYWGIFLSLVANLYNENKDNYAFYDGSIGGIENTITHLFSPEHSISNLNLCYQNRYNMGYEQGVLDRNEIINSLKKDKSGRIVEQIRIIAHSMGAAYAKGFAQALVEFAQMFPNLCEGLRIVEYDFAPYQPEQQTSVSGVDTYQFSHKDDWIAGFNPEKGNVTYLDPFIAKGTSHSLSSFEEEIYNLKEGRYIFENGKFIYVGSPKY